MTTQVGTTAKGTVIRVLDYGAIVRLDDGRTGLLHISQITDAYIQDVRRYFEERDEVTVKVLGLNSKGRLEFSTKQLGGAPVRNQTRDSVPATAPLRSEASGEPVSTAQARPASFEERLSRFLKDSDERMHELKRHSECRRGRR